MDMADMCIVQETSMRATTTRMSDRINIVTYT